jgi:hypothetical protein
MKTKTQNRKTRLKNRSEQLSTDNKATAQTEQKDNRTAKDSLPPIDHQQRTKNRTLPTPTVLNQLLNTLPDVYGLAEVVGRRPDSGWVWVQFKETPAAGIRQQLAQLGFHWNNQRQTWQHPCGQFRLSSTNDPHERYSSYFPADTRPA